MIYDEATRSDSHFNHLSVFLLPNEMGGSQTRLLLVIGVCVRGRIKYHGKIGHHEGIKILSSV